jgi:uracil-DNA glycosylase
LSTLIFFMKKILKAYKLNKKTQKRLMDLPSDWKGALEKKLTKDFFAKMKVFLERERALGHSIFPAQEELFSAFHLTPLSSLKVVIVGQDPYHGKNQAHGLAFSVKHTKKLPPSLKNIFKEVCRDTGAINQTGGNLEPWAERGVFLYNTCLTVRENAPFSHRGLGWEEFTSAVFYVLSELKGPVVFMFWGKAALHYAKEIEEKRNPKFLILKASHPSPFSCKGFFGCSHFSKANDFLEFWGKTPISWN